MRDLRERAEPALKILCLVLAVLVGCELVGIGKRWNPFRGVTVPQLPALTSATNNPPGGAHGTNLVATAALKGTNGAPHSVSTNATTNVVVQLAAKPGGTNSATVTLVSTNGGTNPVLSATAKGTNAAAGPKPGIGMAGGMMPPGMAGPPGKRGADLPPAVQSRISRITDSEILGPVMHPLPMALMGIAGQVAFLRSASGQTGLVKEGDSLDDIKLLRIGVNRVLIEQNGQKKELMIFSGYGGESLLQNDSTNENKHL